MTTRPRNTNALPVKKETAPMAIPSQKGQRRKAAEIFPSSQKVSSPKTTRASKTAKAKTDESAPKGEAQRQVLERESEKSMVKVIRDGFTMPKVEYDRLKELKTVCLKRGVEVKKSELLRAGLQALLVMSTDDLISCIGGLTVVKVGRKKA
jgi:hypothetical protein